METIEEFNGVTGLVQELLRSDERCRNDDKWLTYRVMSHFTKIFIPFEDFKIIPTFETVSRCRRKIQNKHLMYPPTSEDVIKRRHVRRIQVNMWSRQ